MKQPMKLLSITLFLFSIPIVEKEVHVVSETSTYTMKVKGNEQRDLIRPNGVWLPGDLEDEELP